MKQWKWESVYEREREIVCVRVSKSKRGGREYWKRAEVEIEWG